MKILFLTHYFYPEGNAPATRVYEMCKRWVTAGHEVTVITGVPNVPNGLVYDGYRNRWRQEEMVAGIRTIRVWTYIAANKGTCRRTLNYLSFMVSALGCGLRVERPDVVIATSPQFFCGWAGVWVSRLRRWPFVLEIRDIWPESIVTVGAMSEGPAVSVLTRFARRMYSAATHIVTVGDGYKGELLTHGVPDDGISVVPNGVDRDLFAPRDTPNALISRYNLRGKFVCSYIGTIGMACGLEVVLRAASLLKAERRDDIVFLLVGDGALREDLQTQTRDRGLDNVIFAGRQDKNVIPDYIASSDACLIHLRRRPLFRSVLPSKIFEAAAMRKPIILGLEGVAADLITDARAGICVEPESERQLADAVMKLADDPAMVLDLGGAAYDNIASQYDFDELARSYLGLLQQVVDETEDP